MEAKPFVISSIFPTGILSGGDLPGGFPPRPIVIIIVVVVVGSGGFVIVFGFQIRRFSVVFHCDEGFDCVSEHGPCIEINLTYTNRLSDPLPLEYDIQDDVTYHEVEWLDNHHRLFDPTVD